MRVFAPVFLLALSVFFYACGSAQKPFDPGPRGTLRLVGDPPDAILEIDETRLGPISMFEKKGVLLKPGSHRVVVKKEGFFPEYLMIEVMKDKMETIEIKLRPVPE